LVLEDRRGQQHWRCACVWLQFSCCGAVGPQDFLNSAWYNRTDVSGVYVPGSCCVDRPMMDAGGKQIVLSAAAKVTDCQHTAEGYVRKINNPNGPDPSLHGSVHFLQTQVGLFFNLQTFTEAKRLLIANIIIIIIIFTCVRPSVRLSVCLSVTRWYCIKTAEYIVMLSSPHDRAFILVLCVSRS